MKTSKHTKKSKNKQRELHQTKKLLYNRGTMGRVKRGQTQQEKKNLFSSYSFDMELRFRIHIRHQNELPVKDKRERTYSFENVGKQVEQVLIKMTGNTQKVYEIESA